jgi:hypothetical protein
MKWFTLCICLGLVLVSRQDSGAGPKEGGQKFKRVVASDQPFEVELNFKRGERATVIVKADRLEVPADLFLEVRNLKGQLITRDDAGGHFAAVIWYPPQDGIYKIKVSAKTTDKIGCYVAVR